MQSPISCAKDPLQQCLDSLKLAAVNQGAVLSLAHLTCAMSNCCSPAVPS